MRRQLSGHCVSLTGVWQQGCQKYPRASDTSRDSGAQGPAGDSSLRHAHVASTRPAYQESVSEALPLPRTRRLTEMEIWPKTLAAKLHAQSVF